MPKVTAIDGITPVAIPLSELKKKHG